MGLFEKLFGKRNALKEEELIEAGACPNCWGKQEYADQFVQYVEDQTKSNINNDKTKRKAFVQQFVETNLTGIRLKKDGDQLSCPSCSGKFKKVSSKAN